MAEKLLLLFMGYVKIRLSGYAAERFINLCMKHHIKIWNVCNHGNCYTLYMGCNSFKHIKPIVKKTKTKAVILEKKGLPFFMFRYRKRKLFFAGIVLFAILLYVLSLFIWDITLKGNKSYTTEVMLEFLEDIHVQYGMMKHEVDCAAIEKEIRTAFPYVTWASARVEGTKLMIELKESENRELTSEEKLGSSSLYSPAEGEIVHMITRVGVPQAALYDTVSKDQILISGTIPVYEDSGEIKKYQYVCADGDVSVKTLYHYEDKFLRNYEKYCPTGKRRKGILLKILHHEFDFQYKNIPFEHYEILKETRNLKLSEYFYLPASVTVQTILETKVQKADYTKEEAIALGNQRLLKFIADLEEKGVQIIEKNVKIGMSGKYCVAKGTILLVTKETVRKPIEAGNEEINERN